MPTLSSQGLLHFFTSSIKSKLGCGGSLLPRKANVGLLSLLGCRDRNVLSHRESFCREVIHRRSWLADAKDSHAQSGHESVFWEESACDRGTYLGEG